MKKITPFLWFDTEAEAAAKFYVSLFKNSKITNVSRMGGPKAPVMSVSFHLDGQDFIALNAGPKFKFNESISMFVNCKNQAEVDRLWKKLTANGGQESMCGWLKDRFGLSWQIIPEGLGQLIQKPAAAQAMFQMRKIDLKTLKAAAKKG